jgi:hypothetical protein
MPSAIAPTLNHRIQPRKMNVGIGNLQNLINVTTPIVLNLNVQIMSDKNVFEKY